MKKKEIKLVKSKRCKDTEYEIFVDRNSIKISKAENSNPIDIYNKLQRKPLTLVKGMNLYLKNVLTILFFYCIISINKMNFNIELKRKKKYGKLCDDL